VRTNNVGPGGLVREELVHLLCGPVVRTHLPKSDT
jgi:hypothetical protein